MEPACAARFGDGMRRPAIWKRSSLCSPVRSDTVPRERYQFGVRFRVVTRKRVVFSATGVQVASVTGGWNIDFADVGEAAGCADATAAAPNTRQAAMRCFSMVISLPDRMRPRRGSAAALAAAPDWSHAAASPADARSG